MLFFTTAQLLNPIVMEDPQPLAKWNFSAAGMTAREMILQYDFRLDEATITNQLRQVV